MDYVESSQKATNIGQLGPKDKHPSERESSIPKPNRSTSASHSSGGVLSVFKKGWEMLTSDQGSDPPVRSEHSSDPSRDHQAKPKDQSPVTWKTQGRNHPPLERRRPSRQAEHHQNIHEKEAKIKHLTQLHEKNAVKIGQLENALDEYTVFIEDRDRHIHHLNAVNQDLGAKISRLEQKNMKLEGMILARQESALESMVGDSGYAPKEDRLVQDELAKLGEKIRAWARKHSVTSYDSLNDVGESCKNEVVKELAGCTFHLDWESLIGDMPFSPSKAPALLVQALLSKQVFGRMFVDPFFAFTKVNYNPNEPDFDGVRRIYDMMLQGRDADAHTWRSQTLRNILSPADTKAGCFLRQRAGSICSALVVEFLSGPAGLLLRPVGNDGPTTQRGKELRALYNGAAELALSLWSQRTFMTCQIQQDLPVFTAANSMMSAHRLHQLDDDDHKLDGRKVILCVQPAIIAFGSENAEHYDRYKVWAPAVVVVDEKSGC